MAIHPVPLIPTAVAGAAPIAADAGTPADAGLARGGCAALECSGQTRHPGPPSPAPPPRGHPCLVSAPLPACPLPTFQPDDYLLAPYQPVVPLLPDYEPHCHACQVAACTQTTLPSKRHTCRPHYLLPKYQPCTTSTANLQTSMSPASPPCPCY